MAAASPGACWSRKRIRLPADALEPECRIWPRSVSSTRRLRSGAVVELLLGVDDATVDVLHFLEMRIELMQQAVGGRLAAEERARHAVSRRG